MLTVEHGCAHSHTKLGWEIFTDEVIKILNRNSNPIVFLLWGACAQKKASFINDNYHYVLKTSHPSPLSAYRGFFGCKHFSKTNQLIKSIGLKPINWLLPNF